MRSIDLTNLCLSTYCSPEKVRIISELFESRDLNLSKKSLNCWDYVENGVMCFFLITFVSFPKKQRNSFLCTKARRYFDPFFIYFLNVLIRLGLGSSYFFSFLSFVISASTFRLFPFLTINFSSIIYFLDAIL